MGFASNLNDLVLADDQIMVINSLQNKAKALSLAKWSTISTQSQAQEELRSFKVAHIKHREGEAQGEHQQEQGKR